MVLSLLHTSYAQNPWVVGGRGWGGSYLPDLVSSNPWITVLVKHPLRLSMQSLLQCEATKPATGNQPQEVQLVDMTHLLIYGAPDGYLVSTRAGRGCLRHSLGPGGAHSSGQGIHTNNWN